MPRLLVILGACYAVSLVALLSIRVVPGVPWQILLGFVFHFIPLALTLAWSLTKLEDRYTPQTAEAKPGINRQLLVALAGVSLGTALVWFFDWTDPVPVRIALSVFAVWQLVVGSARTFVKPLAFSILVLAAGFGTVWNINYLAGTLIPIASLHDQTLLDFDLAFYSDWLGREGLGTLELYPVVNNTTALKFLEHAYMLYYDEIFIVMFVLLYRGGDLTRFFSILFGCFIVGIPIFLIYPTIGPFTFAPETIQIAWRESSSTFKLMQGVLNDWQALREGAMLKGYGYFIAMPSMHIAVATVLQVFAWRCRPIFWMLVPINVLLFLSTFLLGWHYILDAPAGLIVAGITFGAARICDRWLNVSRSP